MAVDVERYANAVRTTLTSNYTAGDGHIDVASTAPPWPTSPVFHGAIWDSTHTTRKLIFKVTAITSGTRFAITPETTDTNCVIGDLVDGSWWSVDAILQTRANITRSDLLANLPANADSYEGDLFFPSDDPSIKRFNGSSWQSFTTGGGVRFGPIASRPAANSVPSGTVYRCTDSPYEFVCDATSPARWLAFCFGIPVTEPILGDFTQVNTGGSTVSSARGGIIINHAASSTDHAHFVISAPAAPYSIVIGFLLTTPNNNFNGAGLSLRKSGTGEFVQMIKFSSNNADQTRIDISKWNSNTSFNGTYTAPAPQAAWLGAPMCFLKIEDNNTDRLFSIGDDPWNFIQVASVGRTDFITPDQIGMLLMPSDGSFAVTAWFLHCEVTS